MLAQGGIDGRPGVCGCVCVDDINNECVNKIDLNHFSDDFTTPNDTLQHSTYT